MGGENITENVEGRERYPINIRSGREFRNNVEAGLDRHPSGSQIPIGEVAHQITFALASHDPGRRWGPDRLCLH